MMTVKTQWLVITDLDGSLLNHDNYGWQAAIPALELLAEREIPIIFNTSKTYAETIRLQQQIGIEAPFIVENGSCIYFPKKQFLELPSPHATARGNHWAVKLGSSVTEIDRYLSHVINENDQFIRLSDCTPQQAKELTGLSLEQAQDAINREFSEPILWQGNQAGLKDFCRRLDSQKLNTLQGGRFLHIQGNTDKGLAIKKLRQFYPRPVKNIVIGDSANDSNMLQQADIPVVVNAPGNQHLLKIMQPSFITVQQAPAGWSEAVHYALNKIDAGDQL